MEQRQFYETKILMRSAAARRKTEGEGEKPRMEEGIIIYIWGE